MDFRAPVPAAPLPGTQPPARAFFIDRWGTLFQGPSPEPALNFEDVEFTPGATDALFRVQQAGWSIYLIGNEEQVAFGKQSLAEWNRFEEELLEHLAGLGIRVRRNYACTDHPQGKGRHARDSVFQLPNTGAFYHACQHDGVQLRESWVVGDGCLELAAGWRAGCHVARVDAPFPGYGPPDSLAVDPELHAHTLADALAEIQVTGARLGA